MYVIRNNDTGKFVARSGSESSYTNAIQNARVFSTKESAQRHLCVDNETVVPVSSVLNLVPDDSNR